MTNAADMIVTELQGGPASARELSQRLDGISYASIRQMLCRLAKAGVVTKIKRGVYQRAACDHRDCSEILHSTILEEVRHAKFKREPKWVVPKWPVDASRPSVVGGFQYALEMGWEDFEATNDPYDHRAWV